MAYSVFSGLGDVCSAQGLVFCDYGKALSRLRVSAVSVKDWDRNGDFSVSRYLSLCLFLGVWTRVSAKALGVLVLVFLFVWTRVFLAFSGAAAYR